VIRRAFLSTALMLCGFGRRAWAQAASSTPRYATLTKPARVRLDQVAVPWRPAAFTAEGMSAPTATQPSHRVLLAGVLVRRGERSEPADLSAVCLTCPHEQCRVELITEPARLATIEGAVGTPVFLCGCHESAFDASKDGAWLAGPAPRGLYQFRITALSADEVEIGEVEEQALSEA
jgi:Rieske Fe-S protein